MQKLSTSEYVHRLSAHRTFDRRSANALITRGFGIASREDVDTKPVLDFMHALESRPPSAPFDKLQIKSVHGSPNQDVGGQTEDLAYTAFSGQPRALSGFEGSGQRFNAKVTQGILRGKPELAVTGTSRRAYTLSFTMAEHRVEVQIPAHSSGRNSAGLIAAAINAASDAIARSDDGSAFGSWTDSGLAGVKAVAKGSTVFITPDIHD